jgi:hypothetical protein
LAGRFDAPYVDLLWEMADIGKCNFVLEMNQIIDRENITGTGSGDD